MVDRDVCSLVFYSSVTSEFWHGFIAKLVLLGFVLCNVFVLAVLMKHFCLFHTLRSSSSTSALVCGKCMEGT